MRIWSTCLFHKRPSFNRTQNVSEPICSSKIPDSHLGLLWKFTTLTALPICNILSIRFLSVDLLVSSVFVVTLIDKSGYTRSSINSITGDWPVVDCGNIRYRAKTPNNRVSRSTGTFLSPLLIVCTARSDSSFEEGWYEAHLTCFMPFRGKNLKNSLLVKLLALSDTITCGVLCVANMRRNILFVSGEDGDDTICASIYLLWASTITRIHLLLIGSA